MPSIAPKKNLVLFSMDARRKDFFETFGGIYPSPNLTRLAGRGLRFDRMYAAAASTIMSLSAVLNGRPCHEFHRRLYHHADLFEDNLFSVMRRAGRRNHFILSEDLLPYADGIYRGEDAERILLPTEGFRSTVLASKVVEVARQSAQPFFIFTHVCPNVPCDETESASWRNNVERHVREEDNAVGILLDGLDLDETCLVVYSDHGELMGEHGGLNSHAFFLYEPVVNVPCIASSDVPGVSSEMLAAIQLHDLVLGEEIRTPQTIFADTQYSQQQHRVTMALRGEWKYMAHYSPHTAVTGHKEELYDLRTDPGENRNVLRFRGRHPLRADWNIADMSNYGRSSFYHYDRRVVEEALEPLRDAVASIWAREFLEGIEGRNELLYQKMSARLETASPAERLEIVGKTVGSWHWSDTRYGGPENPVDAEGNPIKIPFDFPGLPAE